MGFAAVPKSLVVVDINERILTELTRDLRSTNNLLILTIMLLIQ